MSTNEELVRENRQLRERLTKLTEASLRISESLDIDTVLREVAGSARALCGAGLSGPGGSAILDEATAKSRRKRRDKAPGSEWKRCSATAFPPRTLGGGELTDMQTSRG